MFTKRRLETSQKQYRRGYVLVAAIAIGIALLLLLLPHAHAVDASVYLVVLPIIFIGVLPSPCVMSPVEYMRLGLRPDDPVQPASFQRPPPCLLP
jgi:hypothetical protein